MKGKQFVNFLAYGAIMLVALALVLQRIFNAVGLSSTLIGVMNTVAQCIAYAITAVFAFLYAKSKRNIWFMISYIIAVVLIIVMVGIIVVKA